MSGTGAAGREILGMQIYPWLFKKAKPPFKTFVGIYALYQVLLGIIADECSLTLQLEFMSKFQPINTQNSLKMIINH